MLSTLIDGCFLFNTSGNFNQHCFDKQATTTSNITSAEELVGMDIHYSLGNNLLLTELKIN